MAGRVDDLYVDWAGCGGKRGGRGRETRVEGGEGGGGCGRRVDDS